MDPRPFHNGYGMNTVIGVPKPAYRAFEIMHQVGDRLLDAQRSGPNSTASCYALRNDSAVTVLCANWITYPLPIAPENVAVELCGLTREPTDASTRFIDDKHGNARPMWEALGSPTYPTDAEVAAMQMASMVIAQGQAYTYEVGSGCVSFTLQVQAYGVAATTIVF